jgi:DNA-binding NarL/FixJ family response regulator
LEAAERAIETGCRMLGIGALDMALRFDAPPGPIAARLRELTGSCDTPWLDVFAAHAEALAADDGAALDAAADALEARGALLRAALAAAAAAEAHARAGRRSSATRSRGRAARLLTGCPGAVGVAVPRHDVVPPVDLTRREREIAGMAATGLSNAEIAGRLGVGVRTVEGHLLRASTKLGIRRRADLAAALDTA